MKPGLTFPTSTPTIYYQYCTSGQIINIRYLSFYFSLSIPKLVDANLSEIPFFSFTKHSLFN